MSGTSGKPSLLYVSPTILSMTGNGLAMRGGIVLEALAEKYDVTLLAAPRDPLLTLEPDAIRAMCRDVAVIPLDMDPQDRIQRAAESFCGQCFDIVHVFRLAALPFARPYFAQPQGRQRRHLDLDDVESKTYRRVAALYEEAGDERRAKNERARAQRSMLLEGAALKMFDRIYVCSEADRREMLARSSNADVRVLRNAVRRPAGVRTAIRGGEFRFLFVGTLGYYPNEDALYYFCERILPVIREAAPMPFRVDFVGAAPPRRLMEWSAPANANIVGAVSDVQPWYDAAHAVIVPLRAAGGTRIKIIEAFAYRRPVVTTSIGMEGLEGEAGRHFLVADEPADFANACLRLMSDPNLSEELTANGAGLFEEFYSIEALRKTVASL